MSDLLPWPDFFLPQGDHASIVLILGLGLWILLIFWARRRPGRLALRLLLTTLAMIALIVWGLRPAYLIQEPTETALLLTPGYTTEGIDTLTSDHIFTYQVAPPDSISAAVPLADPLLLRWEYPSVSHLVLAGEGLPLRQLEGLESLAVTFLSGPRPIGLVDWWHDRQVRAGQPIHFSGSYRAAGGSQGTLLLSGPLGETELVTYDSGGLYPFAHREPARQEGRWLYELRELDSAGQLVRQELVPVQVLPSSKPAILMLETAPSFEGQYLKRWLVDQGFPVMRRSAISRDRYLTEVFNREGVELDPLRRQALASFDLALVSASALASLSPEERAALRQAVQEGMGLVIGLQESLPEMAVSERAFFLPFRLQGRMATFQLPKAPIDLSRAPFAIRPQAGLENLIRSREGDCLVAFRATGLGRIGLVLPTDTYRLLLEGQADAYAGFWTETLEAAARRIPEDPSWGLAMPWPPRRDHRVGIQLETSQARPSGTLIDPGKDSIQIPFRQDPLLTHRWHTAFWPLRTGWHALQTSNASEGVSWLFVAADTSWASLRTATRVRETEAWVARQQQLKDPGKEGPMVPQPYPQAWMFALFVVASAALWLEERW